MTTAALDSVVADLPRFPRRPFADADVEHTDDLDVFRDRLNGAFYPARVESRGRTARPAVSELSALRMTCLTIGFVRPGADIVVDPGPLGGYHVNVALAGRVQSSCGPRHAVAEPGRATVFTPEEHTTLPRWSADAAQLCIKIRRSALEAEAARLLGRPLDRTVDFDLELDLRAAPGQGWLGALGLLLGELRRPGGLAASSQAYRESLERLVIGGLVLAARSSLTADLCGAGRPLRPRTVQRVLDLIAADPAAPLTLGDLASHAGVSVRRLQQAFHEHVGTSPMAHVRAVRLERAHRDLHGTDLSIAAIAARWGFGNLGRFAAAYRATYGEPPSAARRH
jgi:AraC-like DNA-binding protein